MDTTELCFTPALELSALIRAKALSPVELAEAVLARVERLNPKLNAFVTVTADLARRQAKAAEERVRLARDLHDGTLQFLAGTAMQLTALSRELGAGQETASERIQRLLEDLKSEQRQLRVLIDSTSAPPRAGNRPADFQDEVRNLAAVLARRWSTDISVNVEQPADRELPGNLAFELLQIVRRAGDQLPAGG